MASDSAITLGEPSLVQADSNNFFLFHPYLLVWTDNNDVHLWKYADGSTDLTYVAPLSTFVGHPDSLWPEYLDSPGPQGVLPTIVISPEQNIIVIPSVDAEDSITPVLYVYSLTDGQHLRTCALYDTLGRLPLLYSNGQVLAHVNGPEGDTSPRGNTKLLLCDVAGEAGLQNPSGLKVPNSALAVTDDGTEGYGTFRPVFFGPNGDVVATWSDDMKGAMDIYTYRGPVTDDQQPDTTTHLDTTYTDGSAMITTCSMPLSEKMFVLGIYEGYDSSSTWKTSGHTTFRAYSLGDKSTGDAGSPKAVWASEPIWGRLYDVQHVPSLNLLVVVGERDLREDDAQPEHEWTTVIAALDTKTGAQRTLQSINHRAQGTSIAKVSIAGVSADASELTLVVVFKNGSVTAVSFKSFLAKGFERDADVIDVLSGFQTQLEELNVVAVGHRSVLATATGEEGVQRVWCVDW